MEMPVDDACDELVRARGEMTTHDPLFSEVDSLLIPLELYHRSLHIELLGPMDTKVPSPGQCDIMLLDISAEDLRADIAQELGVEYLLPAEPILLNKGETRTVSGTIYGSNNRVMIALPVQKLNKCVHVIFLIDTGSPYTYLCNDALRALGHNEHVPKSTRATLGGIPGFHVELSPPTMHFADVNVLGASFLSRTEAKLVVDYGKGGSVSLTYSY